MNNFLLNVEKSDLNKAIIDTHGWNETLIYGGKILLIGMATIFSVLCLIWLCLSLFKVFFHDLKTKKPATVKAAEVEEVKEVAQYQTNDEEIIAVIAAAIAMAESESTGVKFRVVSFKRK